MSAIRKFLTCEAGATAVEYGLIAALISVALIAGFGSAASSLSTMMTTVAEKLDVN